MLFSFVLECALFRWAGGVWWGREHESSDHSVSLTFFIFFDSHDTTLAWFFPYLSQHPSSVHTAGCSTTWIGLLKHQCEALSLLTPQLCLGCVCVGGRGAVIVFIFRAPRFISQAQISLLGSRVMVKSFIDTFTFLSQIRYAESHCRLHSCSPLMLPHPWKIKKTLAVSLTSLPSRGGTYVPYPWIWKTLIGVMMWSFSQLPYFVLQCIWNRICCLEVGSFHSQTSNHVASALGPGSR